MDEKPYIVLYQIAKNFRNVNLLQLMKHINFYTQFQDSGELGQQIWGLDHSGSIVIMLASSLGLFNILLFHDNFYSYPCDPPAPFYRPSVLVACMLARS